MKSENWDTDNESVSPVSFCLSTKVTSGWLCLIHWIVDTPLLSQAVHELHDVEGFGMRHLTRFKESFNECFATGEEFILISCYLLRHMDILNELTYRECSRYLLRIVDIINDKIAIGSSNHSDIITHAGSTRLNISKDAVRQHTRLMALVRSIPVLALNALTLNFFNARREEHADEIQSIDTEVEQRTTTEVGT